MTKKADVLRGTLDMLILRILDRGDDHGWGITQKLEQFSNRALQLDEGTLYPALYRMEDRGWLASEWRMTENDRRAKYYALTKAGRKQLEAQKESWDRMIGIIEAVMNAP